MQIKKITHLIGEVSLEFCDSLKPIGTSFFRDELDVEEGALARTIQVAGGGSPYYTWRHISDNILEEKRST